MTARGEQVQSHRFARREATGNIDDGEQSSGAMRKRNEQGTFDIWRARDRASKDVL